MKKDEEKLVRGILSPLKIYAEIKGYRIRVWPRFGLSKFNSKKEFSEAVQHVEQVIKERLQQEVELIIDRGQLGEYMRRVLGKKTSGHIGIEKKRQLEKLSSNRRKKHKKPPKKKQVEDEEAWKMKKPEE